MKKAFKWTGIVLGSLIVLILLTLFLAPIIFKDDIKLALDDALSENIDAEVVLDIDKFSVSAFTDFPNLEASLEDFGLVGKGEFKGDTLLFADRFAISLNIISMLGDQMQVSSLVLDKPEINVIVLEDGTANYDIYIGESAEAEDEEESEPFKLALDHWGINEGTVTYDDRSSDLYAEINNINHSGDGTLGDQYLINTDTEIENILVEMDGATMLNHAVESNLDATIDMNNGVFTFNENYIKLNAFQFNFDGSVTLVDSLTTGFDLTFGSSQTGFKDILSLVPSVFLDEQFEKIETSGTFGFNGFVKGNLDETNVPAFELTSNIKDGFLQYPGLPSAISNVALDLKVNNPGGSADLTGINMKKFHLDLGENPVDARFYLENLVSMKMESMLKASVNLADFSNFIPMDSLELKGIFDANITAKGIIDTTFESFPTVKGQLGFKDGYVAFGSFPPIENFQVSALFEGSDDLEASFAKVENLSFELQGEPFALEMSFEDFTDIAYNIHANGNLDLEKLTNVFPLEEMTLRGKIAISSFHTKGLQSDIMDGNFLALESNGYGTITDLYYNDIDKVVLEGVKIEHASFQLTPDKIDIEDFKGFLSKSDMEASGYIKNYMGFAFSETDTILKGHFRVHTNRFDIDEWMYEDPNAVASTEEVDEDEEWAIPIPQFIDFEFDVTAKSVMYDGIDVSNASGKLTIKDGNADFRKGRCNVFGSLIKADGIFKTQNFPLQSMEAEMQIEDMEIAKAYEHFKIIQKFVPAADKVDGSFSGDMTLSSIVGLDYFPKYETVNSEGIMTLHNATFKAAETSVFKAIAKSSAKFKVKDMNLNNTKIKFKIIDGQLTTEPFDVKNGNTDYSFTLARGIMGDIDHKIKIGAPAKALASLVPGVDPTDKVTADFLVTGTETDPKVRVNGNETIKGQLNDLIDDKKQEQIDKLLAEAEANAAKIRKEGRTRAQQVRDAGKKNADKIRKETKTNVDKVRKEGYAEADALVKKAGMNPLKKKAAQIAADKLKAETDKKCDKLLKEGEKKAEQTETTANNKADGIEDTADKKADKVVADAEKKAASM